MKMAAEEVRRLREEMSTARNENLQLKVRLLGGPRSLDRPTDRPLARHVCQLGGAGVSRLPSSGDPDSVGQPGPLGRLSGGSISL